MEKRKKTQALEDDISDGFPSVRGPNAPAQERLVPVAAKGGGAKRVGGSKRIADTSRGVRRREMKRREGMRV